MPVITARSGHGPRLAAARAVVALIVAAWPLLAGDAAADPVFPQLTKRIVDEAGLLNGADKHAIERELETIEATSTDQVVVVTLKSLQGYPIEDFGYRLGRAWGIGQKDKDNGAILIVAPNERKVRIEVGRGLEPVLTDAMSKLIIDNAIIPEFRRGDFVAGIKAGVRDIKDVLLGDADAVRERAKVRDRAHDIDTLQIMLFLFWLGVVLFVIWALFRSGLAIPTTSAGRGGKTSGNSGGWSGGWSGGGGGGGGWSGGGGGFGGGGSSGSW
jgi:uncharacterized protein